MKVVCDEGGCDEGGNPRGLQRGGIFDHGLRCKPRLLRSHAVMMTAVIHEDFNVEEYFITI